MRNFKSETEVSISKVKEFVYKAKKETFAATDSKVSKTNQSSILSYRAFDSDQYAGMIYNDEYSGNTIEAGCETVSMDLCNVWRNQFITVEFLKMALLQLPLDFPVRGPHYFQAKQVDFEGVSYYGDWEYENNWKSIPIYQSDDPFSAFQGEECIRCNGIVIYWHGYQGGFLRDKYFPIILSD